MNIWATVSLLAVAILIPTGWVAWLARKATQSERAAIERVIEDSKRASLEQAERQSQSLILEHFTGLDDLEPRVAFQAAVEKPAVASFLQYNENGDLLYPSNATVQASKEFPGLSESESTLQRIQSLIQSGDPQSALLEIHAILGDNRRHERLNDNRPIGPLVVLLGLSVKEQSATSRTALLRALREMSSDYSSWDMPSSQRQFIQGRFLKEQADSSIARLRDAEKLADRWHDYASERLRSNESQSIFLEAGKTIVLDRSRNAVLIFDETQFFEQLDSILSNASAFGALSLQPIRLSRESDKALGKVLGGVFSGWELILSEPATAPGNRQQSESLILYGWISALVILISLSLSIVIAGLIRRQMNLAQLKNDLVSTVSHELKTPIASIRLLVDTLIADKNPDPKKTHDYLELVSKENTRLGHLIENFLSFSRMERGQNAFDLQPCSPNDIATDALSAFRERFAGNDYELTENIDPQANDILADRDAIIAALGNLLENAYKYGGEPKRIKLNLINQDSKVAFSLEDNGAGISPKEQTKVFNRFYQGGERALSEHRGGVGLGLSIVQFIASKHHGEVALESDIGKGSVFTLTIPHA